MTHLLAQHVITRDGRGHRADVIFLVEPAARDRLLHGVDLGAGVFGVVPGLELEEAGVGQADLLPPRLPHARLVPLVAVEGVVDVFFLLFVVARAFLVEALVAADEAGHRTEIAALALDAEALGVVPLPHESHAGAAELPTADDAHFLASDLHEDLRMLPGHPHQMRRGVIASKSAQAHLPSFHDFAPFDVSEPQGSPAVAAGKAEHRRLNSK